MADRRVVVTGLGTINPLGRNVPDFWAGLLQGASGIRPIQRFDASRFSSRIGGEVLDWEGIPSDIMDVREAKRIDRFGQFALVAAAEAVRDSGLELEAEDRTRCGVVVGSGIGGLRTLEEQHLRMLERGPSRVSPFTVPKLMSNAASANISIFWGLCGPNHSVATACASASNAMGDAMRLVQRDLADVMITGGSEAALTEIGLASFCALKGLSTRNDDPQHASRPFDRGRDGFLLSEGAGVVVFEELEHARKRGARIHAEMIGYGASADGYHLTAPKPSGDGAVLAMQYALRDAGVGPRDVDYINTHGTSTVLGDLAEVVAIKRTFGDYATNGLLASSTKSAVGHLLGASGGVELIACALAMRDGVLPATQNLDDPDEQCDIDFIPNTPREVRVDVILNNSFGFGGHNACLLMRRFAG